MSESLKIDADYISPLQNIDLVAGRSRIRRSFKWETIHRNGWNLILITSGSGSAKINGETIQMNAGALYLFAPSDSPRQLFSAGWVAYWARFQLLSPPEWPQKSPGAFELKPPPQEFRRCVRDLAEVFRLALGLHRGWHPLAVRLLETIILRGNMLSVSGRLELVGLLPLDRHRGGGAGERPLHRCRSRAVEARQADHRG